MSSIAGNTSTSAVLALGETETHTIDAASDFDWFAVTLVEGQQYSFTVSSSGGPGIGLTGPDITLYSGTGVSLESSTVFSSATNTITFRATASGSYFVGVGDGSNATGQYALTWNAEDSIRDDVTTNRDLVPDGSVAGNLEVAEDSDWFGFDMVSGLSYGIELRGATTNPLEGSDIQLRDANGNILDFHTSFSGTVNSLNYNPTATGGYFLSVNDGNNDTGGYTISLTASDTIQNNISTTKTLARGATQSSALDVVGDSDWFKVTMKAGETYGFQVLGRTTNPLQWADLQLRDAQGNILWSFNSFSAATNTLAFTAATAGTYFVSISDSGNDTGGYSLRNIGADSVRADVLTASRLVNGGSLTGEIEMISDSDWHRIETQQGVSYTFTLSGDGSGRELADTRLILRDAAGNILAQDFGTDSAITFTATTHGPLFVEVKGDQNDADFGKYVLTAVSNATTLTGTANADRIQGGAGATVINAGGGNDRADGGVGTDRLFGAAGNDKLYGNADADKLYGGIGDDKLFGGSGGDTLEGEAGNDSLEGGGGADIFLFRPGANADTITDFQDGADRIRIIGGPSGFGGLTLTTLGEDVRVSFGAVSILVQDITRAELTADDFLFS